MTRNTLTGADETTILSRMGPGPADAHYHTPAQDALRARQSAGETIGRAEWRRAYRADLSYVCPVCPPPVETDRDYLRAHPASPDSAQGRYDAEQAQCFTMLWQGDHSPDRRCILTRGHVGPHADGRTWPR